MVALGAVGVVVSLVSLILGSGRDSPPVRASSSAVLAVRLRRPELVWGSIVGVTLMAVQLLALRRYRNGNWTGGLLGGTGAKLAFWAMFAIGLTACRPTTGRVEP